MKLKEKFKFLKLAEENAKKNLENDITKSVEVLEEEDNIDNDVMIDDETFYFNLHKESLDKKIKNNNSPAIEDYKKIIILYDKAKYDGKYENLRRAINDFQQNHNYDNILMNQIQIISGEIDRAAIDPNFFHNENYIFFDSKFFYHFEFI